MSNRWYNVVVLVKLYFGLKTNWYHSFWQLILLTETRLCKKMQQEFHLLGFGYQLLNYDRISYKIWWRLVKQGKNVYRITYWTFVCTINPLNSTLIPYLYPTPYIYSLKTFVYIYIPSGNNVIRLKKRRCNFTSQRFLIKLLSVHSISTMSSGRFSQS